MAKERKEKEQKPAKVRQVHRKTNSARVMARNEKEEKT